MTFGKWIEIATWHINCHSEEEQSSDVEISTFDLGTFQ